MLCFRSLNQTIQIERSLEGSWDFQSSFHEIFPTLNLIEQSPLISLKLRSTSSLNLRLQTLRTLFLSKLWYQLLTMELPIFVYKFLIMQ